MSPQLLLTLKKISWVLLASFSLLSSATFAAESQTEGVWRYTVRPGDNLITLGKQHLINPDDWKVVQRLNKIKNPYRMFAGKTLRVPLGLVKQRPAKAEIVFVNGAAYLQRSAKQQDPLTVGQQLTAGATITTEDKSKVVIQFADGTTTELASNSRLKLDSMSLYSGGAMVDTKLRLQKGQLETHANPKHIEGNKTQVITPSAIAAVRGTQFRVTADDKATTQETLDGSVVLGAQGGEVAVDKGVGSKAEFGKAPIPPVTLLPAASAKGLKQQYQTLPVTFDMPRMAGATAWAGKVATTAKLEHLVAEAEAQGQQLVFADVPDGDYFLNFRAKDKNGIAGYDAMHQFTVNARPLQPSVIAPVEAGVVRDAHPVLAWQPVDGAQLYAVEIAKDSAFKTPVEAKRITDAQHKVDVTLDGGDYYWRVSSIAMNEQGQEDRGPALKVSQFTYKPLPPVMVETIAPLDGFSYLATLDNTFNGQKKVWQGRDLGEKFGFSLREYGKQTLRIQHLDADGAVGPAAVYEFDAIPQ